MKNVGIFGNLDMVEFKLKDQYHIVRVDMIVMSNYLRLK